MKRIFYLVLLVTIVSLGTISCSKEQIGSPASVGDNTNSNGPKSMNLTANNWQKDQNDLYVHTFHNILSSATGYRVNVYLLINGEELQINSFIPFMGGQLWATYTTTDVNIFFRNNSAPPPSLDIKVVTE